MLFSDSDDSLPKEEITKIVVGLCGLVPGLVVLICGFIYYKKKSAIYASVCQGEDIKRPKTLKEYLVLPVLC